MSRTRVLLDRLNARDKGRPKSLVALIGTMIGPIFPAPPEKPTRISAALRKYRRERQLKQRQARASRRRNR